MHFEYRTDRLSLRVLDENDANKSLMFYLTGSKLFNTVEPSKPNEFYTLSYQRALLRSEYESFLDGSYLRYYITTIDNPDTIIGTASYGQITKGVYHSCILGYKLHPNYHKQGYALEALTALNHAVFTEHHMHRIEAFVLPHNEPSIRLLMRLGFECEGMARSVIRLDNGYTDHLRFARINPFD